MTKLTRRPLIAAALASSAFIHPACAQGADADFSGTWGGVLQAGSQSLRLRLVVEGGGATLYSLDQGGDPIPGQGLRVDGDRLRVEFPAIGAAYDGRLRDGLIVGEFRQGARLPLTFARGEAPAASAPTPLTQARLAALRAEAGAPALAAAASNRDGRALALADGVRVQGRQPRVTTSDVWHLGSITKAMTATLVARLVEAGAVSWDDTVAGVLGGDMRAEYREVSFRHLLSHRAGLQANIPMSDFLQYRRELDDPRVERIRFARQALAQPPHGPMETSFLYSNSGYVIAGAMLEARLAESWEALIRSRLFRPLAMASAGFGAPGTPDAFDQPVGHAAGLLGPRPFPPGEPITDNPAALGPAGRVHARFEDVLKFLAAHRDRTDLLRPESWDILHTPPFGGDYAMGWVRRGDALWHNGSNTLWYAEVTFDPGRGVCAVAAANDGRLATASPAVGAALSGSVAAVA